MVKFNNYFSGLNHFTIGITALVLSIFIFTGTLMAQAPDIPAATCQGAELQFPAGSDVNPDACNFTGAAPEEKLNQLVATIVNLFSVIVGVVAVLMIIVGGFRYITSGGDSGNVNTAKNTLLYAIVGLVIVAFAQFIVKFVLAKAISAGS